MRRKLAAIAAAILAVTAAILILLPSDCGLTPSQARQCNHLWNQEQLYSMMGESAGQAMPGAGITDLEKALTVLSRMKNDHCPEGKYPVHAG